MKFALLWDAYKMPFAKCVIFSIFIVQHVSEDLDQVLNLNLTYLFLTLSDK